MEFLLGMPAICEKTVSNTHSANIQHYAPASSYSSRLLLVFATYVFCHIQFILSYGYTFDNVIRQLCHRTSFDYRFVYAVMAADAVTLYWPLNDFNMVLLYQCTGAGTFCRLDLDLSQYMRAPGTQDGACLLSCLFGSHEA